MEAANVEHVWLLDDHGDPDTMAHDVEVGSGGHNGPRCTVCGFFFCVHCAPQGWQHCCPGPPPEDATFDWSGDGTGSPPETPEVS